MAMAHHDTGRAGRDLRRSRLSYVLLVLFACVPFADALVFIGVVGAIDWTGLQGQNTYGTDTRTLARVAQLVAIPVTICITLYSLHILRRWQVCVILFVLLRRGTPRREPRSRTGCEAGRRHRGGIVHAVDLHAPIAHGCHLCGVRQVSAPRHAAMAATQFALLPEYTTICLVLDVGKLAYPFGNRVFVVTLMMVRARIATSCRCAARVCSRPACSGPCRVLT